MAWWLYHIICKCDKELIYDSSNKWQLSALVVRKYLKNTSYPEYVEWINWNILTIHFFSIKYVGENKNYLIQSLISY